MDEQKPHDPKEVAREMVRKLKGVKIPKMPNPPAIEVKMTTPQPDKQMTPKPRKNSKHYLSAFKRKVGKPTVYTPDFCDALIKHMSLGYSYESFTALTHTDVATLYKWETQHPEFGDAKIEAVSQNRLFWEKLGIVGTAGKIPAFNNGCWVFNMKNRFGWHDRQEIRANINSNQPGTQANILIQNNYDEVSLNLHLTTEERERMLEIMQQAKERKEQLKQRRTQEIMDSLKKVEDKIE